MVVGRGSFIEAFPLFGLPLEDYDSLFAEKLDLLLKIRDNELVNWSGKYRPALTGQGVYPRPHVYLLRKHPQGRLVVVVYEYKPTDVLSPSIPPRRWRPEA